VRLRRERVGSIPRAAEKGSSRKLSVALGTALLQAYDPEAQELRRGYTLFGKADQDQDYEEGDPGRPMAEHVGSSGEAPA
jgi:hypothetical protein